MNNVDLRLYGLIDPANSGGHDVMQLADAMCRGGVTLIQLRDKTSETRAMVHCAANLRQVLHKHKVPLLINDRVDVAIASGADGVHLGQDDLEADVARRMLGPDAIIGLTVRSREEAESAPLDEIDYVALGGVFATTSKDNKTRPIGLEGLAELGGMIRARRPHMPVCAIAGIDETNTASVIEAGADGVAVISAIAGTSDPAASAQTLRGLVDEALKQRETE